MRKAIDRRLFIILLGYMGGYHIVYIGRRVILKAIERIEYADVSWWETIFQPILTNFLTVPPLIVLILIITKIMIDKDLKWSYIFLIHFVLSFVYSFALTALYYVYRYLVYGNSIIEKGFEEYLVITMFGSNLNYLGYVGFVTIIYSYYYIQKTSQAKIQEAQLSEQLQQVKMQVMKSQLNPHFLFNTLNSVSSLIIEDTIKAQQMIGDLGDLLREVLLVKDKNMIKVSKEMIILNKYIDIMQTRFSDHLRVEKVITKEVEDFLIPSMLLQPILENSFKHGYSYDVTSLKVFLSIYKRGKWLIIDIQNDGAPISSNSSFSGLGIQNIQARLAALYRDNFYFSFSNLKDGNGVATKIKIPLNFT